MDNSEHQPPPHMQGDDISEGAGDETPADALPEMPDWLSDAAAEIWDDIVPKLSKDGKLDVVDEGLLAQYCTVKARMIKAQQHIDEFGETYMTKGKHGDMYRFRPEYTIVKDCQKELREITKEFGLSPNSRRKLGDQRQGSFDGDSGWGDF